MSCSVFSRSDSQLEGPYGSLSIPVFEHPHVVLCAGGVGATPLMSVLGSLVARQQAQRYAREGVPYTVHLVWICREQVRVCWCCSSCLPC